MQDQSGLQEETLDLVPGEMAQWLRELPALAEDRHLVPSSSMRKLSTTFNSSSKVFKSLF